MIKFNPITDYRFSEADLKYVNELSKVGYVHILSSQVSLMSEKGKGFQFLQYGNDNIPECPGMILPENWVIEGICHDEHFVKITFRVLQEIN